MSKPYITLYSLSTCTRCRLIKHLLDATDASYQAINVDLFQGEVQNAILDEIRKYNQKVSFPTTVIGDKVIVGNNIEKIRQEIENHP